MTPITVYPWEVEPGDLILGLRTPVATVLQTDGKVWIYAAADGTIIARRPHWGRVQVVRDSHVCDDDCARDGDQFAADWYIQADPTPPHGIARVHGLYEVTP